MGFVESSKFTTEVTDIASLTSDNDTVVPERDFGAKGNAGNTPLFLSLFARIDTRNAFLLLRSKIHNALLLSLLLYPIVSVKNLFTAVPMRHSTMPRCNAVNNVNLNSLWSKCICHHFLAYGPATSSILPYLHSELSILPNGGGHQSCGGQSNIRS